MKGGKIWIIIAVVFVVAFVAVAVMKHESGPPLGAQFAIYETGQSVRYIVPRKTQRCGIDTDLTDCAIVRCVEIRFGKNPEINFGETIARTCKGTIVRLGS
jgi:hypothetical protein